MSKYLLPSLCMFLLSACCSHFEFACKHDPGILRLRIENAQTGQSLIDSAFRRNTFCCALTGGQRRRMECSYYGNAGEMLALDIDELHPDVAYLVLNGTDTDTLQFFCTKEEDRCCNDFYNIDSARYNGIRLEAPNRSEGVSTIKK